MSFETLIEKYQYTASLVQMIHDDPTEVLTLQQLTDAACKLLANELLEDHIALGILDECIPSHDIDVVSEHYPEFHCDNTDAKILMEEFLGMDSPISSHIQEQFLMNIYDHNADIIQSIIREIESMAEESDADRFAEDTVDRCKDMNMAMGV